MLWFTFTNDFIYHLIVIWVIWSIFVFSLVDFIGDLASLLFLLSWIPSKLVQIFLKNSIILGLNSRKSGSLCLHFLKFLLLLGVFLLESYLRLPWFIRHLKIASRLLLLLLLNRLSIKFIINHFIYRVLCWAWILISHKIILKLSFWINLYFRFFIFNWRRFSVNFLLLYVWIHI